MSADEGGSRLARLGPWMGIAFVALFVAGFLVFPTPTDSRSAVRTLKWATWWKNSDHRTQAIIGAYLMVLGVLAFVWFAWSLRERVRDRGGLMFTFGSVFAAVALVSALIRASIPGAKEFGSTPVPVNELPQQFDSIGFALLLVAGALAAGLFVLLASLLARQDRTLPLWLIISGFVVAAAQLGGVVFFPFVLFPLWVLVTSILLIQRERLVPFLSSE
ncbi:MAG TPA: hypothetical protein VG869_10685 [Acidimicrobiia bacterium]|nr:hypothetical protein [Acidimicrobiia bacterium]HEV3451662.1 hypothetical protein [Acidimicrobiia bacterium]